jgi:hypothetical protein
MRLIKFASVNNVDPRVIPPEVVIDVPAETAPRRVVAVIELLPRTTVLLPAPIALNPITISLALPLAPALVSAPK